MQRSPRFLLTLLVATGGLALATTASAQETDPLSDYTTPTESVTTDPPAATEESGQGVKPESQSGSEPSGNSGTLPSTTRGEAPSQLAFTGFTAWLVIVAGLGLLTAALGLQLRTRRSSSD